MKLTLASIGLFLFAGGFAAGYLARGGDPGENGERDIATGPRAERRARPEDAREDGLAKARRRARERREQPEERRPRREEERRPAAEVLDDLDRALAGGDLRSARHALHELADSGDVVLEPEMRARLAAHLRSGDRRLVHEFARALAAAGGPEGVALVLDVADDSDLPMDLRRHALEALGHVPPERAGDVLPQLESYLAGDGPAELEHTAARAFGQLHGERGVGALLGLLGREGVTAPAIFDAVGDVGRPEDAAVLVGMLSEERGGRETESLLRALGRLSARGDSPSVLLDLLDEPPVGASRQMVARALADSWHEVSTATLGEALARTGGDARAQESIARALMRAGGTESLEVLLEAAADPDIGIDRRVLAHALGEFRGEAAVPLMLDLLRESQDEEVLEPLARGLARAADAGTVEELVGMLERDGAQGGAWRRRAIAHALEEAGGTVLSAERLLALMEGERDAEVASSLVRALDRLHPGELDGRAEELFRGAETSAERIAFARLLEGRGGESTVDVVAGQLEREGDPRARWELARVLGRMGDEGVARVGEIIGSEAEVERRHQMLWGLEAASRRGSADVRGLVLGLAASDPAPEIRGQAAEILARQADASVIPQLERLLELESHPEVRERIQRAVAELAEGR